MPEKNQKQPKLPVITEELDIIGNIFKSFAEAINDPVKGEYYEKLGREFLAGQNSGTDLETNEPRPDEDLIYHQPGEVVFFGYGANMDPTMLGKITGHPFEDNIRPAVLRGYDLHVQPLDKVKPQEAYNILDDAWKGKFASYTAGEGEGLVEGVVVQFSPLDLMLMEDWELVNFGWRRIVPVTVEVEGQPVFAYTEMVEPKQDLGKKVEGQNYPPFIMHDKSVWLNVAEHSREEAMERLERLGLVREAGEDPLIEITGEAELNS